VEIYGLSGAANRDALEQALGADPCHVDALLAQYRTLSACELEPLVRAWDSAPLSLSVLDELGTQYITCGHFADAVEVLEVAAQVDSSSLRLDRLAEAQRLLALEKGRPE
ncbi:MAG: hypothetical protein HN348_24870, partial [Proteobacteria bacterium]|nr:hypothetical protein [Pseudomonadota bacterium]